MDIFIEQLVKRKKGSKDILIWVGVLLGIAIILFLVFAMAPVLLLPVLIGLIAAAYFILSSRNIEYEYSVTNSDITIDKIINRRKRKNVLSVDAHDIEFLGKYTRRILMLNPVRSASMHRITKKERTRGALQRAIHRREMSLCCSARMKRF